MNSYDYFYLVYENNWIFLLSFSITIVVYFLVYRKYYLSLLDPFTYAIFFSAMAVTVPIFLFFIGKISFILFLSFLLTQGFFFIGFLLVSPLKLNFSETKNTLSGLELRFLKYFFLLISTTHILLQLYSYKLFGIPLFAESRLGIYGESGGINNLLKRVLDIISQCNVFLVIFFLFQKKNFGFRIFTSISMCAIICFLVLSGSKGALITLGHAFFVYSVYQIRLGNNHFFFKIKKIIYKFGIFALLGAVLVISYSEDTTNPLVFLLYRIASSGDVFFMAYPGDVINLIPSSNWFLGLFSSPLSLLGIIPRSMVSESMGFFLMKYHHPEIEFRGPNPRLNVFSYVYFGIIFSPVFCFLIGLLTSFIRNKLFGILPGNILGCIYYFLLLNMAITLEPDFHNALSQLINIVVVLPIFIITAYSLSITNSK